MQTYSSFKDLLLYFQTEKYELLLCMDLKLCMLFKTLVGFEVDYLAGKLISTRLILNYI